MSYDVADPTPDGPYPARPAGSHRATPDHATTTDPDTRSPLPTLSGLPSRPTTATDDTHAGLPAAPTSRPAPAVPAVPGLRTNPLSPATPAVPTPKSSARSAGAPALPAAASAAGVEHLTAAEEAAQAIQINDLLGYMLTEGGSDLHLSAGAPPVIRVRGEMRPIPDAPVLRPEALRETLYGIMNSRAQKTFEEKWELNFAYTVPGEARFRVNVLKQRGSMGAVMRAIPWEIKSLDSLGLPESFEDFASLPRGLVLVTGPTGSGKSTTLAAIVDKANRTRKAHIVTIEDPIEFLHQHRSSIVNQREVGEDTHSFAEALKQVLRQDPDIILVGELRDLETISVALTAAETGHLVFATLHTQSAQETITRVVDVFPAGSQAQVQTQLAASLQAVVCQELCRTVDGTGRVAALEIMRVDSNIRSLIRDKKLHQIQSALQTGRGKGMQTMTSHLVELVKTGTIHVDEGYNKSSDKDSFIELLGGAQALDKFRRQAEHQVTGQGYAAIPTAPIGAATTGTDRVPPVARA